MEGRLATTFTGHQDSVQSVCVTKDNNIISVDRKGILFQWDRINQTPKHKNKIFLNPTLAAVDLPDGTVLLSGSGDAIYHFKFKDTSENIFPAKQYQRHQVFPTFMHMQQIDRFGNFIILDTSSACCLFKFNYLTKKIGNVKKVPDRGFIDKSYCGCDYKDGLIAVSCNDKIDFHDSDTLKVKFSIPAKDIGKVKFLENGLIACASMKTSFIEIWDWKDKEIDKILKKHKDVLDFLEIQPGILLSAGGDKMIRIWDVNLGISLGTLQGHKWAVNKIIPLTNFMIMSASDDETIKIWQLKIQTSDYIKLINRQKLLDIKFLYVEL